MKSKVEAEFTYKSREKTKSARRLLESVGHSQKGAKLCYVFPFFYYFADAISFEEVDNVSEKVDDLHGGIVAVTSKQVNEQIAIVPKKAYSNSENMDLTLDQICSYLPVLVDQQTALVLLDIKEKLKLNGNFDFKIKSLVHSL